MSRKKRAAGAIQPNFWLKVVRVFWATFHETLLQRETEIAPRVTRMKRLRDTVYTLRALPTGLMKSEEFTRRIGNDFLGDYPVVCLLANRERPNASHVRKPGVRLKRRPIFSFDGRWVQLIVPDELKEGRQHWDEVARKVDAMFPLLRKAA